jgi:predicted Zn-dependent peptidase
MLNLAFSEKSLDVQRHVVIEEFKQRYLNQPYGDVWLLLRPLAYKVHPYKWATIGKDISHIEEATLDDVKYFFKKYYAPNNAILCVSGNCNLQNVKELCEKWFAPITAAEVPVRRLPKEPQQTEPRYLKVEKDVPYDQIYKAWHCCSRSDAEFYSTDLLSDVLSRGKSSRMYQQLVKEKKLFTDVGAYMMGELDKSLIVVEGKLVNGVKMEEAEQAIAEVLEEIKQDVNIDELNKVKNKIESGLVFAEMNIANKALNLSYFEMLGDAEVANRQAELYNAVTPENIKNIAKEIITEENCSTLYYCSKAVPPTLLEKSGEQSQADN